jgi:hypothetical protein
MISCKPRGNAVSNLMSNMIRSMDHPIGPVESAFIAAGVTVSMVAVVQSVVIVLSWLAQVL